MPIYEFCCHNCGNKLEKFLKLSEYGNLPSCCDGLMDRMLSAPSAIINDNTCYKSQLTGEMITSRRQHRTHLKEHGCIEVGNENPYNKRHDDSDTSLKQTIIEASRTTLKPIKRGKR